LLANQCLAFFLFGGRVILEECWPLTAVASCPVAVAFCPLTTYSVLLSIGIVDEADCVVAVFVLLTACVFFERPDVCADANPAMPKINADDKNIFSLKMNFY